MSEFDVIVVGGGIMGSATALHLALSAPRMKIALIERDICGSHASAANFGNVRTNGRPPSQIPLSLRSRQVWAGLGELVGNACEYERTGALKLGFCDDDMNELESHVRDARDGFGLKTELLGARRLRELFPWVDRSAVGARYSHDDGAANPRLVAAAFPRAARAAGVSMFEGTELRQAAHTGSRFSLETHDGRRWSASMLVNCAGAWANLLACQFGEPAPMQARGPQMGVTEPVPYFIVPSTSTVGSPIYFRQVRRGNIVFGGGPRAEVSLDKVRHYALPENTARQSALLRRAVPALSAVRVIRAWSGIEGYMSDGMPVLGASSRIPGLFHAFGFSGSGFQLGPGVGAVLSELILTGTTATSIAAFDIRRFAADLENEKAQP